jgi:hypothetical protein
MITLFMKSRIQPAWRVQQSHTSAHGREPLKGESEAVAVWPVLHTTRQVNVFTLQSFKGFQYRAIPSLQQSLGNLQPVVWIDADEMRVERRMMNLGKRNAVRDYGLAELFVLWATMCAASSNKGAGRPDRAQCPL